MYDWFRLSNIMNVRKKKIGFFDVNYIILCNLI